MQQEQNSATFKNIRTQGKAGFSNQKHYNLPFKYTVPKPVQGRWKRII